MAMGPIENGNGARPVQRGVEHGAVDPLPVMRPIGSMGIEVAPVRRGYGTIVQRLGAVPEINRGSIVARPESARAATPITVAELTDTAAATPYSRTEITGDDAPTISALLTSEALPVLTSGHDVVAIDASSERVTRGLKDAAGDHRIRTAEWQGSPDQWLSNIHTPGLYAEIIAGSMPSPDDRPVNRGAERITIENLVRKLGKPDPENNNIVAPPPLGMLYKALGTAIGAEVAGPELSADQKNLANKAIPDQLFTGQFDRLVDLFDHLGKLANDHNADRRPSDPATGEKQTHPFVGDPNPQLILFPVDHHGRDPQRVAEMLTLSIVLSLGGSSSIGRPKDVIIGDFDRLSPQTRKVVVDTLAEKQINLVATRQRTMDDPNLREFGAADTKVLGRISDRGAAERILAVGPKHEVSKLASVAGNFGGNTSTNDGWQKGTNRGTNTGTSRGSGGKGKDRSPNSGTSGGTSDGTNKGTSGGTGEGTSWGNTTTYNNVEESVVKPEEVMTLLPGEAVAFGRNEPVLVDTLHNIDVGSPYTLNELLQPMAPVEKIEDLTVEDIKQNLEPWWKTIWTDPEFWKHPVEWIYDRRDTPTAIRIQTQQSIDIVYGVAAQMRDAGLDPRHFFSGVELRPPVDHMLTPSMMHGLKYLGEHANVGNQQELVEQFVEQEGITVEQLAQRVDSHDAIVVFAGLSAPLQHRVLHRMADVLGAKVLDQVDPRIERDRAKAAQKKNNFKGTQVMLPANYRRPSQSP